MHYRITGSINDSMKSTPQMMMMMSVKLAQKLHKSVVS